MDYTASSYERKRFMTMMDWWEGLLLEDYVVEDVEFDESEIELIPYREKAQRWGILRSQGTGSLYLFNLIYL